MKPHTSFARRLWIFLIVGFVLYSVVGFVAAPPILKNQLVSRLTTELGRPVRIASVRVNPWVLSLTINGLAVTDRDGGGFVSWDRIYVNFDAASFFVKEWRFQEITAAAPAGRVVVNKDGRLNYSDLVEKFAKESKPGEKPGWPLRVAKLVVTQAQFDFADHSRAQEFKTHLGPVDFSLVRFYTAPNRNAPYEFTAATESGEKLRWLGTVSVNPLGSEGDFVIQGIALAKYSPYYHDLVQLDVLGGLLDVSGHYKADLSGTAPLAQLTEGHVHLTGFKAAARASTAPVLELDDLEVNGLAADAAALTMKATKVALNGGRASVHRAQDGKIDLLAMITPPPSSASAISPPSAPTSSPAKAEPPKPQVEVAALSVRQFSAVFEDRALPRVATTKIENAEFDVEKFTLADGASIPVRASLTLPNHGTINASGPVVLTPLQATLAVDLANVSLATISPYVEPMLNVRITQGSLSTKGDAHLALAPDHPAELTYKGDAKVDHFGMVDGVANEELAGWSELTLNGIDFASSPLALTLKEVVCNQPSAHVIINRDHAINLLAIMRESKEPAGPAAGVKLPTSAPANAAPPPKIEVTKVAVNDGAFTFNDRSVTPEVHTAVNHFTGTVMGLSSENPAHADVNMQAVVDGGGPIAITGKLDPLGAKKTVDLKVELKDVELTPFSPYSGKFAGYELARGKLFLNTKTQLLDRKVDMTNAVTLTQFTFGAPTESPDAVKLPVRLAVALLKDREGKIVLDIPVQGSLDDPQFQVGGVVLHVIGNLLTKVAVSPFSLLGAMFGGGGEELAFQDFGPGEEELNPENLKKLQTLTKALNERPGLNLEIVGSFDQAADVSSLKQRRLVTMIRSRRWDERRAVDANVPPPDQLVITPDEELATVRKLFAEKFPEGGVVATPPPAATPASPPKAAPPKTTPEKPQEKKGFFKRTADIVTLKPWRERRSEKKEKKKEAEAAAAVAAPAPVAQPGPTEAPAGPGLDEMKARLAEKIDVTNDDLRRLAARRAQRVRDYFVQQQIAGERLFLANVANEGKGTRVFLQLR